MMSFENTYWPLNTKGVNNKIPAVGFGTYLISDKTTIYKALDTALAAGYRLIDTAAVYNNESHIKDALNVLLPKYKLTRKDLFITSKLDPKDHGDEKTVINAVNRSLNNLGTDYLDLFLIHWPGTFKVSSNSPENFKMRNSTWKALMKIHNNGNGPLKNIGVSNYTTKHIKEILADPSNVVPAVNQVEFHPYYQQSSEFHKVCRDAKIILQAYCSMGGLAGKNSLLNNDIITSIAQKHSISTAQVLLKWALQRNYAIIPKSVTPEKIKLNIELDKELTKEDMESINNIKHIEKFAWQPEKVF